MLASVYESKHRFGGGARISICVVLLQLSSFRSEKNQDNLKLGQSNLEILYSFSLSKAFFFSILGATEFSFHFSFFIALN